MHIVVTNIMNNIVYKTVHVIWSVHHVSNVIIIIIIITT